MTETLAHTIASSETIPQFADVKNPENVFVTAPRFEEGKGYSYKPHTDFEPDAEYIDVYRLEQRQRVAEGVGIMASRSLIEGTVGEVTSKDVRRHLSSSAKKRNTPETATPFVSFTTDPEGLVKGLILRHGFGLRDGSDSVIVKARVHPSRLLSHGAGKQEEVLLMGGVAPEEHQDIHELQDFIEAHVSPETVIDTTAAGEVPRDEAVAKWREVAAQTAKAA